MPKGIYPRSVRKAVPFVLIEKPVHPDETEKRVDVLKIPLNRGKFAIVDKNMGHLANWNWWISCHGYAVRDSERRAVFLHQAITGRSICGLEIDHVNGNKLDDRRCNLRFVTHRENGQNNKRRREGKTWSKFPGVTWYKYDKKWAARIVVGEKSFYLGRFDKEEDAAVVYQNAVKNGVNKNEKKDDDKR